MVDGSEENNSLVTSQSEEFSRGDPDLTRTVSTSRRRSQNNRILRVANFKADHMQLTKMMLADHRDGQRHLLRSIWHGKLSLPIR